MSKAFQTQASKIGIEVLGNEAYDPLATNYTALFEKIKQMGRTASTSAASTTPTAVSS